ncbi:MAG: glycosyl transferase family protein, partial [Alphaproteobacteria bacterium]
MTSAVWIDALAVYFFGIKLLLTTTAALIAISSLDDLFIDALYYGRRLYRRQFVYRRHRPLTADALRRHDERWMAIMVPAWQEAAVIGQMLEHMLATLAYRRFVVFVGLYANDPDTAAAVDGAQ